MSKAGISGARVYLNATNPFIIWAPLVRDDLGVDPEGNSNATTGTVIGDGVPTRQISVNLNNPPVKQITGGINLKF